MSKEFDRYAEMSPVEGEKKYVEYDSEFEQWGIFGEKSGFCYTFASSKKEAEELFKQNYS